MKAILAALLSVGVAASAAAGVGVTQSEFLKISLSPRAAGMAGAFGAVADDLAALEYNPAGLGLISNSQVMAMGAQWLADIRFAGLTGAHVVPYLGTIAVGINVMDSGGGMLGVGEIVGSSADFQASNFLGRAGWGRTLLDNLTVGAGAKILKEDIAEFSSSGISFDAGLIYTPVQKLSVGLAVRNLGVAAAFEENEDSLPVVIKFAGALKAMDGPFGQVVAAADVDYYPAPQNLFRPAVGVEYWGGKYLALRAGYAFRKTDLSEEVGFAAGIGVRWQAWRFDLAYEPFSGLGQTFRVSLNCEIWPRVSLPLPGSVVGEFRSLPAGRIQVSAPPFVTAEAGEGSVLLKWERPEVSSLSGYNVYYRRADEGRFGKFNDEPVVETALIIGGLESNVRYVFTVKAVDAANPPRESVASPQAEAIPY